MSDYTHDLPRVPGDRDGLLPSERLVREALVGPDKPHLYAIGDSFTMGSELACPYGAHPYALAKRINFGVTNDALDACSYDRILRRTMRFVSLWPEGRELFVLVGFGWPARIEFHMGEGDHEHEDERHYLRHSMGTQKRFKRKGDTGPEYEFAKLYEELVFVKEATASRALTHLLALQSFLQTRNIPYLFTNSFWVIRGRDNEVVTEHPLVKMIDTKRFYGFQDPELTFDAWTAANGHPGRMPGGHPDLDAQTAWADHLFNVICDGYLWD